MDTQRWGDASAVLERALTASYKVPGSKTELAFAFQRLGENLYSLAEALRSQGRKDQAGRLYDQAAKAAYTALSLFDRDPDISAADPRRDTCLRVLGYSYFWSERHHEAIRYLKQALAMRSRQEQAGDSETANLLGILAHAYACTRDRKSQVAYMERCLYLLRRTCLEDDPLLIIRMFQMAAFYGVVERSMERKALIEEALGLTCAITEKREEKLASIRHCARVVTDEVRRLAAQNKMREAERLRQKALRCGFMPDHKTDWSPDD